MKKIHALIDKGLEYLHFQFGLPKVVFALAIFGGIPLCFILTVISTVSDAKRIEAQAATIAARPTIPPTATKEPTSIPSPTPIPGPSELLAKLGKAEFKDRLIFTEIKDGQATIAYNMGTVWDEYSGARAFVRSVISLTPKVFAIAGIKSLDIASFTDFTDAYGKKKNDIALRVTISSSTSAKINWKDFVSSNLNRVLLREGDNVYVDPVFRKAWNEEQK